MDCLTYQKGVIMNLSKNDKIQIICDEYGYNDPLQLMEDYMSDSLVPGICMEATCSNTEEYEPDQENGYCSECGRQSVKSLAVLLGII